MSRDRPDRGSRRSSNSIELDERLRLREIPSPFAGLTRAQVDRVVGSVGKEHQQRYSLGLRQLQADLGRVDPTQLLANLPSYFFFHPKGVDTELTQVRPVLPLHLEVVQALTLMRERSEFGREFPVPPALIQRVCDAVRDVAESWANAGLTKLASAGSDRERSRLLAQARIRFHTVAIRNWGFPEQMIDIVSRLFAPLDDPIERATGLRATHLRQMQAAVVSLIEDRYNDMVRRLSRAWAAETVEEAIDAYYREFGDMVDDRPGLLALLEERSADLPQTKLMLLSHRELSFPAIYSLSLDDLVGCYPAPVDGQALLRVAEDWSLSFGDLAGSDPDHFFLDNPVWARPFIRLDAETFFCPNAGLLHSFALETLEEFLSPHPTLVARYEKRRARFLEGEVEALFRRHFPSGATFTGNKWRDDERGAEGENDLLMVLDEFAVVAEAKAGKITSKALRGHPERIEKTVAALVVEPTVQGRAFAELLRANPGVHRFETESGVTNEVDSSGIRRYVAVNVTLELFGLLDLRWPALRDAGLIPEELEPTVTLSLVDLDVLLNVLDSEPRRLHYLSRRTDLEARPHFLGDEFDLLAYYLKTGFHIGDLEFAEDRGVDLGLQSKLIDRFVQDQTSPRLSEWPGTRLAPLWQSLLDDLAAWQPRGWVATSLRLLNVPFTDQRRFANLLDAMASKARRADSPIAVRTSSLPTGPSRRRKKLIAAAFKGFAPEVAASRANGLATQARRGSGESEPLVVYVRVEDRRHPRPVL